MCLVKMRLYLRIYMKQTTDIWKFIQNCRSIDKKNANVALQWKITVNNILSWYQPVTITQFSLLSSIKLYMCLPVCPSCNKVVNQYISTSCLPTCVLSLQHVFYVVLKHVPLCLSIDPKDRGGGTGRGHFRNFAKGPLRGTKILFCRRAWNILSFLDVPGRFSVGPSSFLLKVPG